MTRSWFSRCSASLCVMALGLAACGDAATVPSDGRLPIAIDGLPMHVDAAVGVAGPDGFLVNVTESGTLDGLRPGSYQVVASNVLTIDARYAPATATTSVTVPPGARAAVVEIAYTIATARLQVQVPGLPVGTGAGIVVSGPAGFARDVDSTTTLHLLAPGTYIVTAADITSGGTVYRPDPATQTVTLAAGDAPRRATVAYGAGSGAIDVDIVGLPAGLDAAVSVTGPGGFSRAVTSSTALRFLEAGTYTVSPALAGADLVTYTPDASQSVVVGEGGSGAATVTYVGAPLALRLELAAEGFTAPVLLLAPEGDARQFVVERPGRVRVIEGGIVLATPFLDIANRVNFIGERGMLGMAFDPGYAENGRFFVFYVDPAGRVVVERFSSAPGSNVAGGSDGIVIAIPHGGSEHHGGTIAFGPDRMLYLGPGDGRCCGDPDNHAQNLHSLLGKILRIDVSAMPYSIPVNNPFAGEFGGAEIWAYGLRNPWRFSFDAAAKLLYIGDVGQDSREEVNVASSSAADGGAGLNYGWPRMEGTACYSPATNCAVGMSLTMPAHEYTHAEGCSVTGGYVYRGSAIPELRGRYLYSDYCRGWLRSFRATAAGATEHRSWSGVSAPFTVSFGLDGAGELYMLSQGRVWKIVRD